MQERKEQLFIATESMVKRRLLWIMVWAIIAAGVTVINPAFATGEEWDDDPPNPPPFNRHGQEQEQGQMQGQEQVAEGGAAVARGGSAVNEGNSTDVDMSSSNTSVNTVLVPNNNTESCLRVFGISFGNGDGAAAIGYPYRSKLCDVNLAAADAFAAGERETGWFWKCQNKNLAAQFKDKGESWDIASEQCLVKMTNGVSQTQAIEALKGQVAVLESTLSEHGAKCNQSKDAMARALIGTDTQAPCNQDK